MIGSILWLANSQAWSSSQIATPPPAQNAARQSAPAQLGNTALLDTKPGSPITAPPSEPVQVAAPISIQNLEQTMLPQYSCPLLDGGGDDDLFAAAENLHSNLTSLLCAHGVIESSTRNNGPDSSSMDQILNSAKVLKKYSDNPLLMKTSAGAQDVTNNLSVVIKGISSVSQSMSANSKNLAKTCDLKSRGTMLKSLSQLIQAASPVALKALQSVPGLTNAVPEAVPFVMGTSTVASMLNALEIVRENNSINISDSNVRLAIRQNVCEFGRIEDRLRESRDSANSLKNLQLETNLIANKRLPYAKLKSNAQLTSEIKSENQEAQRRNVLDGLASHRDPGFLKMINEGDGAMKNADIDRDVLEIKKALFVQPGPAPIKIGQIEFPGLGFLHGDSPVFAWYKDELQQAEQLRNSFSSLMREIREKMIFHDVNPLFWQDCRALESERLDGMIDFQCNPKVAAGTIQTLKSWINDLTYFKTKKYALNTDERKDACADLKRAKSYWEEVLNSLGALMTYCSYVDRYIDKSGNFDSNIIMACKGDRDAHGNLYGKNGIHSFVYDPRTVRAEKDVQHIVERLNDLKCYAQ